MPRPGRGHWYSAKFQRIVAITAVLLVAGGCGAAEEPVSQAASQAAVTMPSAEVATAPPAAASAPTASDAEASERDGQDVEPLTSDTFQTPSGNIRCEAVARSSVECVIASGMNPEPTESDCNLDWRGVYVSAHEASPSCAGDPLMVVSDDADDVPVVGYGQTWQRRAVTCRSERAGLTCTNRRGHGFFLSRAGWRTF